jgi:hypothetical protein
MARPSGLTSSEVVLFPPLRYGLRIDSAVTLKTLRSAAARRPRCTRFSGSARSAVGLRWGWPASAVKSVVS